MTTRIVHVEDPENRDYGVCGTALPKPPAEPDDTMPACTPCLRLLLAEHRDVVASYLNVRQRLDGILTLAMPPGTTLATHPEQDPDA